MIWQQQGTTMKKGKPSLTAELTTLARAAESARIEARRLCHDPLAREFLNAPLRILAGSRILAGLVVWWAERLAPGIPGEVLGRLPDHFVFVPVDFEQEKLHHKLFQEGYDRNKKTFYIWEGETYCLTAKTVDETLAFVLENSGTGSSIIFDYAFHKAIKGAADVEQVNRMLKAWERVGTPLTADEHFICRYPRASPWNPALRVIGVKEGTIR